MNHQDAEITDVMIVLACEGQEAVDQSMSQFTALGLTVVEVNSEEGVIEGSIDSGKVNDLKKVPGVRYVRSVFSYVADFPTGDTRDQDGVEDAVDETE